MKAIRLGVAVLALATAGWSQDGFTVDNRGKDQWPAAEAQKIYFSACAIVEREFAGKRAVRPQFRLVLGAANNSVSFDQHELRLTRWDRFLFAQGVVMLALEDLMPLQQRKEMAIRAVNWADATIEVKQTTK